MQLVIKINPHLNPPHMLDTHFLIKSSSKQDQILTEKILWYSVQPVYPGDEPASMYRIHSNAMCCIVRAKKLARRWVTYAVTLSVGSACLALWSQTENYIRKLCGLNKTFFVHAFKLQAKNFSKILILHFIL